MSSNDLLGNPDRLLTVEELAEVAGVPVKSVRAMGRQGLRPSPSAGGQVRPLSRQRCHNLARLSIRRLKEKTWEWEQRCRSGALSASTAACFGFCSEQPTTAGLAGQIR